jgi:hypothetical protein
MRANNHNDDDDRRRSRWCSHKDDFWTLKVGRVQLAGLEAAGRATVGKLQ